MGRAKQPVSLLVLKGNKNLTKKEIEERQAQEVKVPSDKVKPPSYLPTKLKKEFKKIASELVEIGIMTNLDNDALARFLMAQKMYLDITDTLMKIPCIIKVPNMVKDEYGDKVQDGVIEAANPDFSELLINQDKLFKQCRAAASDLGLTISSRCRLVMPKGKVDNKPKTEAERRFGDRV
ncbi:phage terminase small subunit P27 family [Neobacillus drentensis]|uniref:phage terminase small subunit P27 family n=1 Tax=Neobacillus drentensis TaxID=220684 RepID=UPI002FFDF5EB